MYSGVYIHIPVLYTLYSVLGSMDTEALKLSWIAISRAEVYLIMICTELVRTPYKAVVSYQIHRGHACTTFM